MGLVYLFRNKIYQLVNGVGFIGSNISIGHGIQIRGTIKVLTKGDSKIEIGDRVIINSGKNFNIIGGDDRTSFIAYDKAKIIIGKNTGISNSTIVASVGVKIGDNVKIGGDCKIYDNDFHALDFNERRENNQTHINKAPVEIGDDVFVGAHSIILKGVVIGARSIVGAGSVVTSSIPEDEVWAGNPAKFIRSTRETNWID